MDEEEEDKLLLSRLGVTSANPEDIEHDLLKKVENDTLFLGERTEDQVFAECHSTDPSSATQVTLRNKLRAIKFEIDAVSAGIEHRKVVAESENNALDNTDEADIEVEHGNDSSQVSTDGNGITVQEALATERLICLRKTKAQLQNEITKLDEGLFTSSCGNSRLVNELVKKVPNRKQTLKEPKLFFRPSKQEIDAFDEDEDDFDSVLDAASSGLVETEREELVRKGILTPFHNLKGFERRVQRAGSPSRSRLSEEGRNENFASSSIAKAARSISEIAKARATTKLLDVESLPALDGPTCPFQRLRAPLKRTVSPDDLEKKKQKTKRSRRPLPEKIWRKRVKHEEKALTGSDDGEREDSIALDYDAENQEEVEDSVNAKSCTILEGGLKIPDAIFTNLFDYQKVGVQWLWELHCQRAGGIIGDEMGLGKTIQVISFLASLHFSGMYKPSIVICPVTLLRQWQREAKKWYPRFHVEILHDSAHGSDIHQQMRSGGSDYDGEDGSLDGGNERAGSGKSNLRWDDLVGRVTKSESGFLLTTYEQLRILGDKLLDIEWGYAVLDEGHRIRNPNAEITLVCKQLQTVRRIIMTGAPIQNKLSELWSLFDFIFPGKLGVLPVFEAEFAVPITVGGYANATPLQVSTAYRCAAVLRDLIMPYLLRRMKADVNVQLPKKTEHVLFCSLTSEQRSVYRAFLASADVEQIFDGSRNSLYGIDVMRKICNHPDLLEREHCAQHSDYGNPERSGKMKVVAQVLEVWREQGHHVLVFTQTQQMLDILEKFLIASGYIYRRMDGLTPVKQRMALMDEFNNSTEVFVFILTTKVGGLGTNLTGANRVIIYDPDWNPSTDMQARERAWRIGQTRDVTVYRLITRGTIEEKVYHRQIYKHFLTNKILKNPQQKRFFKARDMRDLFTLQDGLDGSTETSNIFGKLSDNVNLGVHDDYQRKQNFPAAHGIYHTAEMKINNHSDSEGSASDSKDTERSGQNGDLIDEETNVLKSLFDAHGIHSALNHDAIVNASDDDRLRMEEQASLVAQRAAEALRESRMLRSRENFAVPTWTGKSGAAGAPTSAPRKFGSMVSANVHGTFKPSVEGSSSKPAGYIVGASSSKALSSAELLSRARADQEREVSYGLEHQLGSSSISTMGRELADNSRSKGPKKSMIVQPEVLIRQLCTFIQQSGGSIESSHIVEHFKERIPPKDLPLFRSLLKEIASLEKGPNGRRWVLKPGYEEGH